MLANIHSVNRLPKQANLLHLFFLLSLNLKLLNKLRDCLTLFLQIVAVSVKILTNLMSIQGPFPTLQVTGSLFLEFK